MIKRKLIDLVKEYQLNQNNECYIEIVSIFENLINKYDGQNSLLISQKYQDENNSYETKYLLNKSQNAITKILSNGFTESTFYDNMYINVKKEQYGEFNRF